MASAITSLTDTELRQLIALLATGATVSSLSMDRAAADIDAIGAELWRRSHGTSAAPLPRGLAHSPLASGRTAGA